MMSLRDQGRPETAPTIDLRNPQEAGWYLDRPWPIACADEPPVVVRVTLDPAGVTTVWRIGSRDPSTLAEWRLVGKVHIDGSVTDLEMKETYEAGVAKGREEEHRKQFEYEAQREREHPEYGAGIRPDLSEKGKGVIAIRIPVKHARGYDAALPRDDADRAPMGVSAIRDINIALKTALCRLEEAKDSSSER